MPELKHLAEIDRRFLRDAVELGRRGWGGVRSNPMVGCVLTRGSECVAEGYHEEYGGPHAEVLALSRAQERAAGATAYVSLEPCDHHGKTPPCTEALREAGIARVVYGGADPGPESGGGGRRLRSFGIRVEGPALSPVEARRENPAFFHATDKRRPYVAIKLAMSLDGRIASAPGRRTRITGTGAQRETHRLRAGFDAIMIGSRTALVDDPLLTVRMAGIPRAKPTRVVLDTRGRLSPRAALLREPGEAPALIFTGRGTPDAWVTRLRETGATVRRVPEGSQGLKLHAVLQDCWEAGIRSILCEGGGTLGSSLLGEGLAERLYLFLSPRLLGAEGVAAFPHGPDDMKEWTSLPSPAIFGRDVLILFDREK